MGLNVKYLIPFGTISLDNQVLSRIEEKPLKSFLINAGIYIVEQKTINSMEKGKAVDMTSLIDGCLKNKSVAVFPSSTLPNL